MLLLAMSCLQGRPMSAAAAELLELDIDGLQLTPGNAPTRGFTEQVEAEGITTRTHHGFCAEALRRPVWDGAELVTDADSVHPPADVDLDDLLDQAELGGLGDTAIEVMYPGHLVGSGREVRAAMDREVPLAVDVSHIHIQREAGTMSPGDWRALQHYDHIAEFHLSANDGRRDQHRPVEQTSFGVEWAIEQAAIRNVALICESYLHRATLGERHAMVDHIRSLMAA